jgi:pyridoxamine 5'-phosphate oxidase
MFAEGYTDPVAAFLRAWAYVQATAPAGLPSATVALATADGQGNPSLRMVLIKEVDDRGFVFYTNTQSRKGRELEANPRAALCFYWHWLKWQVRVEGSVDVVSDAEADAYFASRPRGSQIGAWASDQSEPVESRARLEERARNAEARFAGQDVPRPYFWSGYRVVPDRIEFWQEAPDRLHHRLVFTRTPAGWSRTLLYP